MEHGNERHQIAQGLRYVSSHAPPALSALSALSANVSGSGVSRHSMAADIP